MSIRRHQRNARRSPIVWPVGNGALITPAQSANLIGWFDSSQSGDVSVVSGGVQSIANRQGTASMSNFTAAGSGNRPAYNANPINGLATFTGATGKYMTGTVSALTDFHVMAAVRVPPTLTGYQCLLAFGSFAPGCYVTNTALNLYLAADHTGGVLSASTVHVIEYSRAGTTYLLSIDGTDFTGTIANTATATTVSLFSSTQAGQEYGPFDFGELLVYNAQLSGANRTSNRSQLSAKW